MKINNQARVGYRSMLILAVVVGLLSLGLLFLPDMQLIAFMLSVAALGGLIAGSSGYSEPERRQLGRSYKTAYEGMLLAVMFAYALVELAKWLPIEPAVGFLNARWPGLILALMCALLGLAGLREEEGL
jgi:hypothetical protein